MYNINGCHQQMQLISHISNTKDDLEELIKANNKRNRQPYGEELTTCEVRIMYWISYEFIRKCKTIYNVQRL